jgi:hypothetical protein
MGAKMKQRGKRLCEIQKHTNFGVFLSFTPSFFIFSCMQHLTKVMTMEDNQMLETLYALNLRSEGVNCE